MDQDIQAIIDEMSQNEATWKAVNPEPMCQEWPFQQSLDILVANGFAIVDEKSTWGWKRDAWRDGKPFYHQAYTWTDEGKEACFRYQHSTPMAWAESIHQGKTRHCVVCGRDCYGKNVWAKSGRFRCACMACGAKGHGLQDLGKGE